MSRLMRCVVDELSVTVRAAEYAERIGHGKIVDFSHVLIAASSTVPALTLEDALGHRAATCFEPADQRIATQYVGLPVDDEHDEHDETPAPDAPVKE